MKSKHRLIGYGTLAIILVILYFTLSSYFDFKKFADPLFVKSFLESLGLWSYFVYVLLVLLTIPLPLPSTPIILAGGYVFGTITGTILSLIAGAIGSSIAFWLTRKYGKEILEKMVAKKHIIQFNHLFKKRGISAAFISYIIPMFPSDAVSLMLGLTQISFHTFLGLYFISHIPRYLIVNAVGSDLLHGLSATTFVILSFGLVLILIAIFKEKIKKFMFKELHEIEKDLAKVEKEVGFLD